VDIADAVSGPLREALEAGERDRVLDEFLRLLRAEPPTPQVVVIDDLHWADDATLELLRVVGRRLRRLAVLLVGTYRDHDVGSDHPLRIALGDLPSGSVTELRLSPLSVDAVAALAEGSGLDAVALHRRTGGNPFFVTEALAVRSDLPAKVSDAVFARASRSSPFAQDVLRAASVLGPGWCRRDVLLEVAAHDERALAECVATGMLELDDDGTRFRHELAQRAIYDGLPRTERVALHGRALEALRRLGAGDAAELTHHAVEAVDGDAVLELAPAAAERAAGLGAHREAAAHYAAALRFAERVDDALRAKLLEGHARECLATDDVDRALVSQEAALECWRQLGERSREAACLRSLSYMLWFKGDGTAAVRAAERAVDLLAHTEPPNVELARAYATLAQRLLIHGDATAAVAWAGDATAIAGRVGDEEVAVHALTTIGVTEILLGREGGWQKLERSLRRARAAGLKEEVSRALINLVEASRDTRRYEVADRYRGEATSFLAEHDPDHHLFRRRLLGVLAEIALERGRWPEAVRLAGGLVADPRSAPVTRARALTVLGRLHARRGDDPWPLLDEALALVGPGAEAQELCPLALARAEAAWLAGDLERARAEAESGEPLARGDPWWQGELALWRWKAGGSDRLPKGSAEPYVLHVGGRYREGADAWQSIGCPYNEALALADVDEETELRRALAIFQELGAEPLAGHVTVRLRALGARSVPRGPRRATRRNPAGLTARELEVLALVAEGLRNVDIAERLVVSRKTVDHHVSAILRKLGVATRAAAAEEAERLGLKDGELLAAR
jgi:DNA-binding CsgD family transcriptional regulator/tetratricopeptide (TPR) repeat protein